jgi:hypothetical protein
MGRLQAKKRDKSALGKILLKVPGFWSNGSGTYRSLHSIGLANFFGLFFNHIIAGAYLTAIPM